ncbi:hypothetical protein [Syntrophaceticus schinkii]|uniref:hypothetical protein n=1 Tax=Syntrophaceticus schinkii TaxID=499207 RepID=UPI0018DB0139|nr:hypothetical protein [Syntrophaceticus schinkii]
MSVLTFTQTFNLKDYRSLVLPYAIILVVLSMVGWMGTNEVTLYMSRYFPLFAIIVVGGTTLLLYLANMARRQGSSGGGKKNEDKVNQN